MSERTTPVNNDQADEIDLSALLGTLLDHKWLIIIVTGLFFLVSAVYVLLATPIYQANAVVQVEQKVPELPGLSGLTQALGPATSEATTEIALLTSRTVIGQAVDNLKLEISVEPVRFPLVGSYYARRYLRAHPGEVAPPRFGMNQYDWGGAKLDVFQLDVPASLQGDALTLIAGEHGSYSLLNDAGDTLLKGQAGQVASGHGVTVQVKTLVANAGTQFRVTRSELLDVVLELQGNISAVEQPPASGIIALTYQSADRAEAVRILDQVGESYVRQNVERSSAQAANSLQFVKEQLPNVRRQLEKATGALNAYQTQAHSVDITMQTQGLLTQEVTIEGNIEQLRLQQTQMERLYTPDHPAYKALLQQVGQLQAQKAALEKQIGGLPDTQQELLRLSRDVQVSNDTYTYLLNQAQQLDIARAGTVGNVRIVDKAVVGGGPVKPRSRSIVLGGTVLGALLAIVFIYLREMLSRGVEDPALIEKIGLPVYASIPLSPQEREISLKERRRRGSSSAQHLLALSAPADLATEGLRSLRTSLHFARLEAKNNVLMISGSSPNAGKTFVSANLAAVIAQAGQKVLLIDADMRKGSQHKVMGGRPENGLSELISGQIEPLAALRQVQGLKSLHFIARGKIPPNPSELLMHANFTTLLQKLIPHYDLIIIDTPPILAVTDAAVVGHHAGTSLLVVRFGLNQIREIALARQRFEQNGVMLKGAIFNAVERRAAGYSSYGYYEYKSRK